MSHMNNAAQQPCSLPTHLSSAARSSAARPPPSCCWKCCSSAASETLRKRSGGATTRSLVTCTAGSEEAREEGGCSRDGAWPATDTACLRARRRAAAACRPAGWAVAVVAAGGGGVAAAAPGAVAIASVAADSSDRMLHRTQSGSRAERVGVQRRGALAREGSWRALQVGEQRRRPSGLWNCCEDSAVEATDLAVAPHAATSLAPAPLMMPPPSRSLIIRHRSWQVTERRTKALGWKTTK